MGYRFLRISSNFVVYLRQFYTQHPDMEAAPYAEQLAAHLHNAFERSDFYSVELRKLGYDAHEVIGDAEPLQKQWAREHDITYSDDHWMREIALAQIEALQPDVLFLSAWLPNFDAAFVEAARARCKSLRLVIGWVGEALRPAEFFRAHDMVLSCSPETVTYFNNAGKLAHQLHHAFAPQVLDRLTTPAPHTADVGFVGNLDYGTQFHNRRVRTFYGIAQQMNFSLYGTMSGIVYKRRGPVRFVRQGYYTLFNMLQQIGLDRLAQHLPRYATWQGVKERAPYVPMFAFLEPRQQAPVYGLEMYQTVAGFKIGLNAHGPSAHASNMRLYETTGVGTCLLTDWKDDLHTLFEPDSEVVTYRNAEEALEKARYLLDHDTERRAIAAAGQQRALRDHTYLQRTQQLDAYIRAFIHTHGNTSGKRT